MCISVCICQSSDYSIAEMDSYEVQIAVKFCDMEAEPDHNLSTRHKGFYIIGDGIFACMSRDFGIFMPKRLAG